MTLQAALEFIHQLREEYADPARDLPELRTMADLLQLAHSSGITVTESELRTAFCHDWKMRWQAASESRLQ